MSDFRIKICGLRRPEDAAACAQAGATHAGLNFVARSHRCISTEVARDIAAELGPVIPVAVFENTDANTVLRTCGEAHISWAQVHGPLSIEDGARIAADLNLIRALPGSRSTDHAFLEPWADLAQLFLFDGRVPGSGEVWASDHILGSQVCGRPALLAGGLHPGNVGNAIRTIQPGGVDVASGVEGPDKMLSAQQIEAFVQEAQKAVGEMT